MPSQSAYYTLVECDAGEASASDWTLCSGMDPFRDNVFYLLLWRAILALLIALVLMVTRCTALGEALLVGAHVALLFSLGMLVWTSRLDDDRVVRFEAWRMLAKGERPAGSAGRRWACNVVKEITLRFARVGSAVAVGLAALSLLVASE